MQLFRDFQEELAQQEGAKAGRHKGHRQPLVGICPADLLDQQVVGDDGGFPGDHHRGQEDQEQDILPLEVDKGKGIGRQRGGDQLAKHHQQRLDHTVEQVAPQRRLLQGACEILEMQARWGTAWAGKRPARCRTAG